MPELYELLVERAKRQVKQEENRRLSSDTYALIDLVLKLYSATRSDHMAKYTETELPPVITAE